jgi:hypothetical protein
MFSEASLGNWLKAAAGEVADPEDASRFSLTDAIAIPGLYPFNDIPDSENVITVDDSGEIKIENSAGASFTLGSSGKASLANSAGDLKGLVDDIWAELNGLATDVSSWATTVSGTGSAPVIGTSMSPLATAMTARLVTITTKAQLVASLLE